MQINNQVAARSADFDGHGGIEWVDEAASVHRAPATPSLLERKLYLAQPIRSGNRYPRQRNYHGFYYFSQTGTHVSTESLLEARSLAWLDFTRDIVAIAAQPMLVTFTDNTRHFPDFIALHANHRQVVYDIKPSRFIGPDELAQFARTRALCDLVGWGYEVLTELPRIVERNLIWLSHFKFHQFHPGPAAASRLRLALSFPRPFDDAAAQLGLPTMADARSSLAHLIWTGEVRVDLNLCLSDKSIVQRSDSACA